MKDLDYNDWDDEEEEDDDVTRVKVVAVNAEFVEFEYGIKLSSYNESDCCEYHYLHFSDLTLDDFKGLEFDLSNDNFFNRIEGYGIELIPIQEFSVKIPGYGSNNGYYSYLSLIITDDKEFTKIFDISECQDILADQFFYNKFVF